MLKMEIKELEEPFMQKLKSKQKHKSILKTPFAEEIIIIPLKIMFLESGRHDSFDYINFEEFTRNYFKEDGWIIHYNGREVGIPDFSIIKGEHKFYVECKAVNDGLRVNQILWICAHSKEEILIVCEKLE